MDAAFQLCGLEVAPVWDGAALAEIVLSVATRVRNYTQWKNFKGNTG